MYTEISNRSPSFQVGFVVREGLPGTCCALTGEKTKATPREVSRNEWRKINIPAQPLLDFRAWTS